MRIVYLYTRAIRTASWNCTEALHLALRRMGHDVAVCAVDLWGHTQWPTPEQFRSADLILLSGAEHFYQRLLDVPLFAQCWRKAAIWYHESLERPDRRWDFDALQKLAYFHFVPAYADFLRLAKRQDCVVTFLPFGVDVNIFRATSASYNCDVPVGFIGSMYGPRLDFVKQLPPNFLTVLSPAGADNTSLDGVLPLVEAYNRCEIVVNLPSLSNLIVTKVLEVLACGRPLVTPWVADLSVVEGLPLCFPYDGNNPCDFVRVVNAVQAKRSFYEKHVQDAPLLSIHTVEARLQSLLRTVKWRDACLGDF